MTDTSRTPTLGAPTAEPRSSAAERPAGLRRRVLVGCYEVPHFGGGNTARYRLFRRMQEGGVAADYVNLIHPADGEYFRLVFGEVMGNPDGLDNTHNCVLGDELFGPQPAVEKIIVERDPEVLLAGGYIAARLLKEAAPERKVVLMTTGCQAMKTAIARGMVPDYLSFRRAAARGDGVRWPVAGPEKRAVSLADFIVAHSPWVKHLFECFYPSQTGKMYTKLLSIAPFVYEAARPYASWRRPFDERTIDVLFVASDWRRPEKNFDWVKQIVAACPDLRIHVVGNVDGHGDDATFHHLVPDHERLLKLYGDAKTCACPSRFDAAPGVLFEASAMGCNVVCSRNCGNWALCHPELVADPFTLDVFLDRIRLSVSRPFPDRRNLFLQTNVYEELMDILNLV